MYAYAYAYVIPRAVLEYDRGKDGEPGNLGRKIIQKKFESYNHAWLIAVMGNEYRGISSRLDDEEDDLMRDEYLLSPKRSHDIKHMQTGQMDMMNTPLGMDAYYNNAIDMVRFTSYIYSSFQPSLLNRFSILCFPPFAWLQQHGDGASIEWKSDAYGARVMEGKFGDEYDHKYNEESEDEEESGNDGRDYGVRRGYK